MSNSGAGSGVPTQCNDVVTPACRRLVHGVRLALGAEPRDIIYNAPPFAESGTPMWHRASFNGSDWCYEHRGSIPIADLEGLYGHGQFAVLNTQLGDTVEPTYPDFVYPVGRFAEWNSELMVSDVFENLHWSGSETGWNL